MTILVQRLSSTGVDVALASYIGLGTFPEHTDLAAYVSYASSGGTQQPQFWQQLADKIRAVLPVCGYPDNRSKVARAKFDRVVGELLGEETALRTGEFLRDDTWAYLSCCLLPDIVAWRFPENPRERYAGGDRNTFQRLFRRAVTLDNGDGPERWTTLSALSEDACVAIFERGIIASRPALVRSIASCWIAHAERLGRGNMEAIMRTAIKLVRLRNVPYDAEWMDARELTKMVDDCFLYAIHLQQHSDTSPAIH